MKRFFSIIFAVVCCHVCSYARISTISGVEATYAGKQVKLMCRMDGIAELNRTLDVADVDANGAFSLSVDIDRPIQAFIPGEIVNAFIYLEPGTNYQVGIPVYQERTLSQKLDPYFKPTDILLQINDLKKTDLNFKLMEFEDAFDFYSVKHLVYGTSVDSIFASIGQMREIFSDFKENGFLSDFMENRFLLLLNSSNQIYKDSMVALLDKRLVDEFNPAFWDIFNNLFDDLIPQLADDRVKYLSFQRVIDEGNAKMYFMLLTKQLGITNQNLKELVAIKLLYDLLNQPQFDQYKVLDLMQRISQGIASEQHRVLLQQIVNTASSNYIGSPAPDFEVTTINGQKKKFSDFKGKFLYLNFENSVIDQTQKDLEILLRIQNDYKKDLTVLNVGLYDSKELVTRLSQRYNEKMVFLLADDSDLVKELYAIKSIPAFFLIDKDGNFLMTRGAEPTDELRMLMQKIFKP